jgi:hypothetical protein
MRRLLGDRHQEAVSHWVKHFAQIEHKGAAVAWATAAVAGKF